MLVVQFIVALIFVPFVIAMLVIAGAAGAVIVSDGIVKLWVAYT